MAQVLSKRWSLAGIPLAMLSAVLFAGCAGGGGGGGGGAGDEEPDLCADVVCEEGEECNADTGECEPVGGEGEGEGESEIASTSPADGATGVAADAVIVITFDKPVDPNSLEGDITPYVELSDPVWSDDNTTVTFTPTASLPEGEYTVTITSVTFADGTTLSAPFAMQFTVGEEPPPAERVWEQAGFGSAGNFIGVYYDANQSGVAYACSDVAGVYRSTDGGRTWEIRSAGLGNYQVASFAVDPFDSDTLYAGAGAFLESDKAGIYVSHDAGLSWTHLPSTYDNGISFRRFRTSDAIAPDPAEQGVILTGSRANGIWRTTDAGESWTQVFLPAETSAALPSIEGDYLISDPEPESYVPPVSVVVFDPSDSSVVYAGLLGGGVVKSSERGVAGSWELVNTGLPESAVIEGLAVSGDGVIYAAAGFDGAFKSTDGGDSWQAINGDVPLADDDGNGWRTFAAVHPTNSDIAYIALATGAVYGVIVTNNGGETWTLIEDLAAVTFDAVNDPTRAWSAQNAPIWQVRIDPFDPNSLLTASFWAIQRSEDGGQTWSDSIAGAQNTCVTDLYFENDTGTLYATHWDAGLLSSADGGDTWTAVFPGGPEDYDAFGGHYWRFAVADEADTAYYYMTCDPWPPTDTSQVVRSTDGLNWTSVFQTPRQQGSFLGGMLGLAIDPTDQATIYVSQDGGQVFKSTDGGDNWAATAGQPEGDSFTYALTVDEDGRVFAGTLLDGLWRSTNGGDTWEQVLVEQGTVNGCLAVGGAVYAAAGDANLYRSTDGGDTWESLTDFTSVDDGDGVGDTGWTVAVDPADPDHILYTREEGWHTADDGPGVVESYDGGETWTELNTGLGLPNVSVLTFGTDGTVYAGTACGGIWRLPVD